MGTAFTYQGRLHDRGTPVTGLYDFQFTLYDGPCPGGSAVGSPSSVALGAVPVTNGLFVVALDFGGATFDGSARWLGMQVKSNLESFGGYWFPEADCGCRLTIQRGNGLVAVTWPATFQGCALETATELPSAPGRTAWTPVNATLVGDTYTFFASTAGGVQQFFRLIGL